MQIDVERDLLPPIASITIKLTRSEVEMIKAYAQIDPHTYQICGSSTAFVLINAIRQTKP